MRHYLPGRHGCLAAGFDAVEQILGRSPAAVLDLGGGVGTTAEAALRRWPAAQVAVLDADPVLLFLARAGLPASMSVLPADLSTAAWRATTSGRYDVVLVVMTLHFLPADRARELYAEIRTVLNPGGVLLMADTVPALGGPARRDDCDLSAPWSRWWSDAAGEPALREPLRSRAQAMAGMTSAEFVGGLDWHRVAALDGGFRCCRTVWRRGDHAMLAMHDTSAR
ncbi:trans-aconitate 2-methyltransferase [Micromonospora sp. AMSO31t]|uniref:class I SAM-dependent methyltransferase n=1 Tax=Micromonospora sp. AMSO31t TaxID=2650566 RepID=UPI001788AA5A|nr:class I SAM-dependent methyltransferase [Micromonospora sp. AMSO31t]